MNKIEMLLNKPCYVIDMLPKKVPADSEGCFFDVESCFLEHGGQDHFRNKLAAILLKLMCYYPVSVFSYNDGRLTDRPTPQTVADLIVRAKDTLGILFGEDTLFLLEQDCRFAGFSVCGESLLYRMPFPAQSHLLQIQHPVPVFRIPICLFGRSNSAVFQKNIMIGNTA